MISNLYEKSYTPFTAKLAPRNMWNRPVLQRKPAKVSRFGADPRVKAFWRFIRSWVCHNHKMYYSYVICCAIGLYNFWWHTLVGYYRSKNAHRSIEAAILSEAEWAINKPKEDDDDDYDEEEE